MLPFAQVLLRLRQGDWMAPLDLKDAYWHVPIKPRFRRFPAFQSGGLPIPDGGRVSAGGPGGAQIHINVKGCGPLFFLDRTPPEGTALFLRDRQHGRGMSRPPRDIQYALCCPFRSDLRPAARFHLSCLPGSPPGGGNVCAHALSRFRGSSVEWELRPEALRLSSAVGTPEVDPFASRPPAQLRPF
ncbi:hypothetical protein GWK47_045013 [Chionoecetes opilio]|uniref:Uncharacterized protein n=1 Tax=Chionoecetes opilio TaxID=41210 RepID=A0A8J4Y7L3_CHIOP|nr:hypothetical protein GWK47_045013 [Chionoecetes opilio]